jgi:hypothetical protein
MPPSRRDIPPEPAARPARGPWRQVLLPSEHGAWAFLAEPVALGLLVAWSATGLLLALAAVAAFLARRPLRLALADRRERKRHPRTPRAEAALALLALAGAAAFTAALARDPGAALFTLRLAVLPGVAALAFDLGGRSREAAGELSAALALSVVTPGIALAGGWSQAAVFGLWLLLVARLVTSVVYVRARLRLEKGAPAGVAGALAVHGAALLAAVVLAARGTTPWLGAAAVGLLGLRAALGLSPWRLRMSTTRLGVSEIVFGAVTLLSLAAGYAGRL